MRLSTLYSYEPPSHQLYMLSSTLEHQCNCLTDLNKHLMLLCRIMLACTVTLKYAQRMYQHRVAMLDYLVPP